MNELPRSIEVVVIGAGQAGLTMSWYLRQAGREHIVLERRDRLGGGWQDRWDAFRLVSPHCYWARRIYYGPDAKWWLAGGQTPRTWTAEKADTSSPRRACYLLPCRPDRGTLLKSSTPG